MKPSFSTRLAASTLLAAITAPAGLSAQEHLQTPQHHHYRLIDMGTFGGNMSGINEASLSVPAVNHRGQAVGFSANSVPQTVLNNPVACFGNFPIFPANVTHAFEWKNNAVTDLGSLAGAAFCSDAQSINERGEIGGVSEIKEIDPLFGWNEVRAIVWNHGQMMNLGTLGGDNSWAFGINNSGQVVGLAQNAIPDSYSIFDFVILGSSAGTQTRAFLWQNGIMQDLGTLGGPDAWASGINARGQIAGQSYVNSTPNPATGFPTLDPFFRDEGEMRDLGSLGGVVGFVEEINNRGQIIGGSSTAATPGACIAPNGSIEFFNPGCDPYSWNGGEMIDLSTHTAGGIPQTADALNDAGQIVGAATFPDQPYDAYLRRQDGKAIDLGHVSGDCMSEAWAINIHSQVVGDSFSCGSTFQHAAFLWEDGSLADLNTLIAPGSRLQLVFANAVNDRGEIAGNGVPLGVSPGDVFTLGHGFLLIPCDENHPNIEGCDYSLTEADDTAPVRGAKSPLIRYPSVQPGAIKGLMRPAGFGSATSRTSRAVFGLPPNSEGIRPATRTMKQVGDVITIQLTASPTILTAGQSVALKAIVHSNGKSVIGATVTFSDGSNALGTSVTTVSPPGEVVFETSTLIKGTHSITASFASNTSAAVTVTVNAVQSTTMLAASPTTVAIGELVTLTANVTGEQPTGTVSFSDGTSKIGVGTLSGGVALTSVSSLGLGSHSFTAAYAGDARNSPSTSAKVSVVVAPSQSSSGGGGSTSLGDVFALLLALTRALRRVPGNPASTRDEPGREPSCQHVDFQSSRQKAPST